MSNAEIKKQYVRAFRGLPDVAQEGVMHPERGSRYGEPIVHSGLGAKLYSLADEGSYFVAGHATPGTGVAGIAAADGYDATEGLILLRNLSPDKRVYLDYILLQATAAGTNGTTTNYIMTADKGTSRYSSGGGAITPKNTNLASADSADVALYFGALVLTAASADVRILADYLARTVIKVAGDRTLFTFGDSQKMVQGDGTKLESTEQLALTIPCPPVVLGQYDQFMLHEAAASQSGAASYRWSMGFWVR